MIRIYVKMERMWKVVVVVYFKAIIHYFDHKV
jgi:hypothetical protein